MENEKSYKIIIVLIVLLAGCLAKNTLDICVFSMKDEKCRADVAIILGAATYNGQVSPVYKERMNHGIALYREGYVDSRTGYSFFVVCPISFDL